MKCTAVLVTESGDAASVVKSIEVDNKGVEGIEVTSVVEGGSIRTTVSAEKPSTLLATLDDVVCCQIAAESAIEDG